MRYSSIRIVLLLSLLLSAAGCGGGGGGGGGGGDDGGEEGFIYVRANFGSDSNRGDSPDSALRTIQAAVDAARRGDMIIVGPGRYAAASGDAVVNIDGRQGSADSPIQIVGDFNGFRTGDAPGPVLVDAAGRLFAFRVTNSSGIVLDSLSISGSGGINAAGVHIRFDSRDIVIRNCEIAANNADGVRITTSSGVLLFNNLIHANQGRGIQVAGGAVDTDIINNTVAQNSNDGISASGGDSRDLFLRNNVVYQNQNRGIDVRESAAQNGYNADYNLVFQRAGVSVAYGPEIGPGPNDINTDPLLANGYRLSQTPEQRTNSPAVDSGDPTTDLQLSDSLRARTTRTNLDPDVGTLDIGYHYPGRFEPPPTRTLPAGTTPPNQITPTPPASSTLYVRVNVGSDTNTGRSPSMALRTIQAAVDRATAGNEIVVGPGTYTGTVRFRAPGGNPQSRITLRANPAGDRTGDDPGDVLIDALAAGTGIFVDAAPYIIIDGFRITNSSASAPAVQIRSGSTGTQVRNCELFKNAEDGIRIQDSDDVVVFNNLIYCNARRGVLIGGALGSDRNQLINNTIVQNGDRGVFVGNSEAASKDAFLRNNIIQNNGVAELQVVTQEANSLEGFDNDFNMIYDEAAGAGQYNGAMPGPNDILEPAHFADIALCDPLELHEGDFRLAQVSAGQSPESMGVDAADPDTDPGFATPLLQRTTATNDNLDSQPLDMGYHFPP